MGFEDVLLKQSKPKTTTKSNATLNAATANANMGKRLTAAGVKPPAEKKPGVFTRVLNTLDKGRNAVASGVMAELTGKGDFIDAAREGFARKKVVQGSDIMKELAKRDAPLPKMLQQTKTGRFLGGLGADILLDPTTYLTVGTSRVAVTGDDLVKGIQREVAKETGKKITTQSAKRLAENAVKGQVPIGKLGTAIKRAQGYQAETKSVKTGFGAVTAAEKKATIKAEAAEKKAQAESLLNQAQEMRQGILPKAGMLPPAKPEPDFIAGIETKPIVRVYRQVNTAEKAAKQAEQIVNEHIKLLKKNSGKGVQQGGLKFDSQGYQTNARYGRVSNNPYWYQKYFKEHGHTPRNKQQWKELADQQLREGYADEYLGGLIPPDPQYLRVVAEMQHGRKLPEEWHALNESIAELEFEFKGKADLEIAKLIDQMKQAQQGILARSGLRGKKPVLSAPLKANVPFVQALPKEKPLPVTNAPARALGKQMAEPLETEAKALIKQAKDLAKSARKVKPVATVSRVTDVQGKAGKNVTTLRFMGMPLADITPVRTALGSAITAIPGMTKVQDALGRMFVFNYTPSAFKGAERAKINAAKEVITSATREAPAVAERALRQTIKQWDGVSKEAASEAPYIIEQTSRGTIEGQKAAQKASEIFAQDVQRFAEEKIPLEVVDNYVTHMYTDPPEVVKEAIARYRQQQVKGGVAPSFTKHRSIPTLEEAKALGLHPVEDVRVLTSIHRAMTEQAVVFQRMGMELRKMGGVVSETNPGNWVQFDSKSIPSLAGMYVHPEVATTLKNLFPVLTNSDEGMKVFANLLAGATNAFKAVAVATPMFHARNFIGNIWLNMADGLFNPKRYAQAAAVMSGKLDAVEVGGRKVPTAVVKQWFENLGLSGQGAFSEVVKEKHLLDEATKLVDNKGFAKVVDRVKHPFTASRDFGALTDSYCRMANFLHHLDMGLSPEDAASMTRKALFDYAELTPMEKQIRRYVMPFYAWKRKSLPRMAERLIGVPGMFTGTAHLVHNAETVNEVDTTHKPEWLEDNMAIAYDKDESGFAHYSTLNLPLTELSSVHDPLEIREWNREIMMMLNPVLTVPAQIALNRAFLSEQDITDTPDLETAALKDYGRFLLSQFGGALGRGVANSQAEEERANLEALKITGGQTPDAERAPKAIPGFPYTIQNPQTWAKNDIYRRNDLLKQAIAEAKQQGVDVPTTKELEPQPQKETTGFGAVLARNSNTGHGFGAVLQRNTVGQAGNAPGIVKQAVQMAGVDESWLPYLTLLMRQESGGNPVARNSQGVRTRHGVEHAAGLFQMLPSTFKEHAQAGHEDINNPLDNTLAAISYIKGRYGHPANIPGLGQKWYRGY